MEPLIITDHYEIDYRHSYAQDSPFFVGLTEGKLMGSRCTACGYTFATPRAHCMQCGAPTAWLELPLNGRVHTFTTCHYGGEAFLKETPFTLVLVEFDGANTLFLSRLRRCGPRRASCTGAFYQDPFHESHRCLVRACVTPWMSWRWPLG